MVLEERIESFAHLGEILRNVADGKPDRSSGQMELVIDNQYRINPWFTPENVRNAVKAIAYELTYDNLIKWTGIYPQLKEKSLPIRAGVIMAGNIPLVGFHDFLSVLISGNELIAKTSSKDSGLIVHISNILCSVNKHFTDKIKFTNDTLSNFNVVIATGSNNSSRYFDFYFGRYPNIIRKNRNSIAIIEGGETSSEIESLGADIFSYFGLGCRNVSKIYIPEGYNLSDLEINWESFSGSILHSKYANNYDFNKAIYIVNKEIFHDTGYLLLKEDSRISSPVSVLYYEYYKSQNDLKQRTDALKEEIQCIVSRHDIPFGMAQSPHLWDYPDGIDTIEFLLKNKYAGIL